MKTTILALLLTLSFAAAQAEPLTAQKGLDKIKSNLENAKKNKDEFEKNLELVNTNMNEIKKTKDAIQAQKKNVSYELVKNTESMSKIASQEREINTLIAKEREKFGVETKQLEQLQGLADQIKKNQEQRNMILADYQSQLSIALTRKTEWKDRETQLRNQESKATESLRGIASDESGWSVKKQKYEKESKRWSAEAQKQQKIHDSYQGLAEGK